MQCCSISRQYGYRRKGRITQPKYSHKIPLFCKVNLVHLCSIAAYKELKFLNKVRLAITYYLYMNTALAEELGLDNIYDTKSDIWWKLICGIYAVPCGEN